MSELNKNEFLQILSELEGIVTNHTKHTMKSKKKFKKLSAYDKQQIKSLVKEYSQKSTLDLYLGRQSYSELKNFIPYLLCLVLDKTSIDISLSIPCNINQFISYIMRDKNFEEFLTYALMNDNSVNSIGSNIISKLFLYIFKDTNPTIPKIKDFLSLYISKSNADIKIHSTLTQEQKDTLNQIKTGVKRIEDKNLNPLNNIGYKKSNKSFSIIDTASNFIKIKYVSNKNNKHDFHKSPREHHRKPTIRHCANGKTVQVKGSIVNRGIA